jgi:hypothetical protein
MAQKETHKYARIINILKQTTKKLEKGDIDPIISRRKGDIFLFPENIVDKNYSIEIKEMDNDKI